MGAEKPEGSISAEAKAHSIGGQALMEGVMMRSPARWAVAVRRPEGVIHVESHPVPSAGRTYPAGVRGVVALGEAMSIGMRALSISARQSSGSDDPPSRGEIAGAMAVSFVAFIVLFVVIPALVAGRGGGDRDPLRNLAEGGLRIGILLAYILLISRMRDIRRVFQYHGAEHKVIAAREAGADATVDGVRPFSTIHVRCGTNFLFLVMMLSVGVFSVVGRDPLWWRLLSRVLLVPVVAGLAYELLRIAARRPRNPLVRLITLPGLALQRITTREPDDDQVLVALAAMRELESASGNG
ncbi:MAG TPA: DUF1385 domain-containing protein [Actinomycetota bacterium]|nr:DUF1385 domain-containing protein [Actinomycetota bacterium]